MRVAFVDAARNGELVREPDPIVFPDWVEVNLVPGHSFRSSARVRDGHLLLSWEASTGYTGRKQLSAEELKRWHKEADGVAKIDVHTGAVEMLPRTAPPQLPAGLAGLTSAVYSTGGFAADRTEPFVVGTVVAALERVRTPANDGFILSLRRWELATGKEEPKVKLGEGSGPGALASLDGRHLAVENAVPKESLPEDERGWRLFDLGTGTQVGQFPQERAEQMTVIGQRAYTDSVENWKVSAEDSVRVVRAFDLATGRLLWERPIRDRRRPGPKG